MKKFVLFLPLLATFIACGSGSAGDAPDATPGSSPGQGDGVGDATIADPLGDDAMLAGDGGDDTLTSGPADAAHEAAAPAPETVGGGTLATPAKGPGPSQATAAAGGGFVLVKNWDFGTNGTIRGTSDLVSEFQFHDEFDTIANGTKYGGIIVAPTKDTAIAYLSSSLNLPDNTQPVEDPSRPTRTFTSDTIQCRVQPLTATQTTCTVSKHDATAGSLVTKWTLPKGGKLLGHDMLWETRIRFVKPCAAFWFSLWTAGNKWEDGAEMDTPESFGSANVFPPAHEFHVNSRGGTDDISYSNWAAGMATAGIAPKSVDLTQWHVWTWVYKKDDSYETWFDDYEVQTGTLHWTLGGTAGAEALDMTFLFDLTWGNTQVSAVNASAVAAANVNMTYEMDYSRVYLR